MFCEVVVCFFGVPANVFRASLQNKIRFASVSEASDAENIGIYSVLCSFSFKNHVPMVPRSQKKCQKMTRGPLHGPLLSSGGILLCGSSLRWSLELCFLTLGMLAMSTAWKIHCNWRCFIWKSRKASINGGFS